MTILPHHIAGIFLLGGLTVGGYFTISALTPSSLEDKLKDLGISLLSNNWSEKETEYKTADGEDLIPSIVKAEGNSSIPDFASKLEKWCNRYKDKYFLGENDPNYKRFSRWCTPTTTIQALLGSRSGLSSLNTEEKTTKFNSYISNENNDKFLQKPASKKDLQESDLNNWCIEKQKANYKYESDPDFKRIIKWCYKS